LMLTVLSNKSMHKATGAYIKNFTSLYTLLVGAKSLFDYVNVELFG